MRYSADDLSCSELLRTRPHETRPWKARYRQALWQAMLGASSLIMLKGLFGSGKTLFVRWTIAEHSYFASLTIPIYLKIRDMDAKLETIAKSLGVELEDVADLLVVAMAYTIRRCSEDKECISDTVLSELRKLMEIARECRGKNLSTIDLLERLADESEYGIALLIDELEYVAWLAGVIAGTPLARRYATLVYRFLSDILSNLYQLLNRGRGYTIVVATSLDLKDLLVTTMRRYLDLRGKVMPSPRVVESLSEFVESLARYFGLHGLVRSIIESRSLDEGWRKLERLESLIKGVEPGVYARLQHSLVDLSYFREDYMEILRINMPHLDLEHHNRKSLVTRFAELAEKARIPPRTFMFLVRRYLEAEAWRETLNAMGYLKGIASKYYGHDLVEALNPIDRALHSEDLEKRVEALCVDLDKIATLSDDVISRVYEISKPIYIDEENRTCLIPRLEILTALFEGFDNSILNPRNPLESITEAIMRLFSRKSHIHRQQS